MMRRVLAVLAIVVAGFAASAAPAAAGSPPALQISDPAGGFFFCCTHPNAHRIVVRNEGGSATAKLTASLYLNLGDALVITEDRCTGRSLGPGRECAIEITWLAGSDTLATLTVSSHKTDASVQMLGVGVP